MIKEDEYMKTVKLQSMKLQQVRRHAVSLILLWNALPLLLFVIILRLPWRLSPLANIPCMIGPPELVLNWVPVPKPTPPCSLSFEPFSNIPFFPFPPICCITTCYSIGWGSRWICWTIGSETAKGSRPTGRWVLGAPLLPTPPLNSYLFPFPIHRRACARKGEIQVNLRRVGPDICRTHWLLSTRTRLQRNPPGQSTEACHNPNLLCLVSAFYLFITKLRTVNMPQRHKPAPLSTPNCKDTCKNGHRLLYYLF